MYPIGSWINHPAHGRGRIANHNDTRYVVNFPGVGLREVDAHSSGITRADPPPQGDPLKQALREVLDEYGFGGAAEIAGRWDGGEIVIRSAREGVQDHRFEVDKLFHKVVMVRDRLRVLEAKVNANKSLSATDKVELQQYITRCYGSLTSFNVLFARDEDKFRGQKK